MCEQDIEKVAGRLVLEIKGLKRDIAAIQAWLEAYRAAAKAVDSQLHYVIRPNRDYGIPQSAPPKVPGLDKLREYPLEDLAAHIADIEEKREQLAHKEKLLADIQ